MVLFKSNFLDMVLRNRTAMSLSGDMAILYHCKDNDSQICVFVDL